jgi:transposase InsO family protein
MTGDDVVRVLEHVTAQRGKPKSIRVDNGRLRDGCLIQHRLLSLDGAQAMTEEWREDYKRVGPHAAPGNQTPSDFARPVDGHAQLPALHG